MLAAGGLVVATVALVLNIVGVAIPNWYYYSEVEQGVKASLYFGLWKLCIKAEAFGQDKTGCRKFDDFNLNVNLPMEMEVARGLELTSIVFIATTVFITGVKVVLKKGDDKHLKVAGGMASIAGLLMLVGAVVFSTSDELKKLIDIQNIDIPFKLHAGFVLCVVSGVLSLAAAVMLIADNDGENRTMPQQYPYQGQSGGVHVVSQQPTAMIVTAQQPSAMIVTAQQPAVQVA